MKIFSYLIKLLFKFLFLLICFIIIIQHINTMNNYDIANFSEDITVKPFSIPVQEKLPSKYRNYTFKYKKKNYTYIITPLYRYKIYAKIYSKKYYNDIDAAPYDLALGWDGLEKKEIFNSINVRQYGRWVHWKLKKECPYDSNQVYLRLANNHIIPANNNISEGLENLKRGDDVYIEGYLVKYDIRKDGKLLGYNESSTTRDDRGNHSCEIIYVTKLVSKYGTYK